MTELVAGGDIKRWPEGAPAVSCSIDMGHIYGRFDFDITAFMDFLREQELSDEHIAELQINFERIEEENLGAVYDSEEDRHTKVPDKNSIIVDPFKLALAIEFSKHDEFKTQVSGANGVEELMNSTMNFWFLHETGHLIDNVGDRNRRIYKKARREQTLRGLARRAMVGLMVAAPIAAAWRFQNMAEDASSPLLIPATLVLLGESLGLWASFVLSEPLPVSKDGKYYSKDKDIEERADNFAAKHIGKQFINAIWKTASQNEETEKSLS